MVVTEHDDEGKPKKEHTLPFKYSMMLPAFKGVEAVFGIEGLTNPRGFITTTDSAFCHAAREAGLKVWCDARLSIGVEHVGDMNFGLVSGGKLV